MKVLRRGMLCRPNRRALLARMVHIASLTTSLQHRALAGDFAAGEDARPDYVRDLENSFGEPNQDGFGSTVLYASSTGDEDLDMLARAAYRYFLGGLWETRGESTWMAQWRMVHERSARGDIVGELHDLTDAPARSSADMITDNVENPALARTALSLVFDDPAVRQLQIYNIGDGEAMSGLLIAARRVNGDATFLVFLMD